MRNLLNKAAATIISLALLFTAMPLESLVSLAQAQETTLDLLRIENNQDTSIRLESGDRVTIKLRQPLSQAWKENAITWVGTQSPNIDCNYQREEITCTVINNVPNTHDTYQIRAQISPLTGWQLSNSVSIDVWPKNTPPTLDIDNYNPPAGRSVRPGESSYDGNLSFNATSEAIRVNKVTLKVEGTNASGNIESVGNNVAEVSISYPTNADQSQKETKICSAVNSSSYLCTGLNMLIPAASNRKAELRIQWAAQDTPDVHFVLADQGDKISVYVDPTGDVDAISLNSATRLNRNTPGVTIAGRSASQAHGYIMTPGIPSTTQAPTPVAPQWGCWDFAGLKSRAFENKSYAQVISLFQNIAYSNRGFSSILVQEVTTVCRDAVSNDTVVVATVSHGNGTYPPQVEITYLKELDEFFTSSGVPSCPVPREFHLNSRGDITCEFPNNGGATRGGNIDFVNDPTLRTTSITMPAQNTTPTTATPNPEAYLTGSHLANIYEDGTTKVMEVMSGTGFKIYANNHNEIAFVYDVSREFCSDADNQILCREYPAIPLRGDECSVIAGRWALGCVLNNRNGNKKGMVVFGAVDKNHNNKRTNNVVVLVQNEEPPSPPTITTPQGGFDALHTPHFSYTTPNDPTTIRIDRQPGDELTIKLDRNGLPPALRNVKIEEWEISMTSGIAKCNDRFKNDMLTCTIAADYKDGGKITGAAIFKVNGKEYQTQRFYVLVAQKEAKVQTGEKIEDFSKRCATRAWNGKGGSYYEDQITEWTFILVDLQTRTGEWGQDAKPSDFCKADDWIVTLKNADGPIAPVDVRHNQDQVWIVKGEKPMSLNVQAIKRAHNFTVRSIPMGFNLPAMPKQAIDTDLNFQQLQKNFKFTTRTINGKTRMDWSNVLTPNQGYYAIYYSRYNGTTDAYEGGAVDIYTNEGTYTFRTEENKRYEVTLEVRKANGNLLFSRTVSIDTRPDTRVVVPYTNINTPPAGYEDYIPRTEEMEVPLDNPIFADININTIAGKAAVFLGATGISGGRPPECPDCRPLFDGNANLNKAEFSKFSLLWLLGPHSFDDPMPQMRDPQTTPRDRVERNYDNLVGPHSFYDPMPGVDYPPPATDITNWKVPHSFTDPMPRMNDPVPQDIDANAWYWIFIKEAIRRGMIQGHPDGRVGPGEQINTATALTIIRRMLGDSWNIGEGFNGQWSDVNGSEWFAEGALMAHDLNLLPHRMNSGKFRPNSTLTRYETAVIFLSLSEALRNR
jgi:hypothetical protein